MTTTVALSHEGPTRSGQRPTRPMRTHPPGRAVVLWSVHQEANLMPHALVEGYITERDQLLNTVRVLKDNAADNNHDPSDADLEVMTKAYARIDKLDELIKVVGEDHEMDAEARARLLSPTPNGGEGDNGTKYRHGGEIVWDCLHATYGSTRDPGDQDAKRRWDTVMRRAAQHMGTSAAATTPIAGGLGGLYVTPIVGPVISLFPQGQPFLTAVGRQPAPSALNFMRPRIVDPDFLTGVAKQNLQKAELVSRKFDVALDSLTLDTVGGYLNVSQQLMSLHPDAWNIIVGQMQTRLAWAGELALVAEVEQTESKVTLAAGADSAAVLGALYEAAALVFSQTKALPTWMAYGPDGWTMLGSLVDAAGRPLFPFLGPANALGSGSLGDMNLGPLGLRQVVSPGIEDTTIFMGNSMGVEAYAYSFPLLEAVEPSVLGRQVAVAEALCFYRPTTEEAGAQGAQGAQEDRDEEGGGNMVARPVTQMVNGKGNGVVTIAP